MPNLFSDLPRRGVPVTARQRAAAGRLSGLVGIACNLLLFATKLTIGTLFGSVSITADAMNNLSDASSSIVTLIGFRLSQKPADAAHPYGHARYEYLSGLAVAATIVIIGFELAKTSVTKIAHPAPVELSAAAAAVLVLSIAVKLGLAAFNRRLGRTIQSATLLATAADSRNDAIATGAVLLAAVVERLTFWQVDGVMGLAVACFILYSGVQLARQTISPLLGEAADPELRERILDNIRANPHVLGYHDLMVHDYGPGQRFASVHVEMDQRESPMFCHEIIDELERECYRSHNVHLVIHYDPIVTDDPELNRIRLVLLDIIHGIDPRMNLHDLRMVRGTQCTNLIFDLALPLDLREQAEQIRQALNLALEARESHKYYTVIHLDFGDTGKDEFALPHSGTTPDAP